MWQKQVSMFSGVFLFWKYWEVIFKQECKTEYVTILLRVIYY